MGKPGVLMVRRNAEKSPMDPRCSLNTAGGVVTDWEIAFVYSAPIRQQDLSLCFHPSARRRRNSSPPFTRGNARWLETTRSHSYNRVPVSCSWPGVTVAHQTDVKRRCLIRRIEITMHSNHSLFTDGL